MISRVSRAEVSKCSPEESSSTGTLRRGRERRDEIPDRLDDTAKARDPRNPRLLETRSPETSDEQRNPTVPLPSEPLPLFPRSPFQPILVSSSPGCLRILSRSPRQLAVFACPSTRLTYDCTAETPSGLFATLFKRNYTVFVWNPTFPTSLSISLCETLSKTIFLNKSAVFQLISWQ